VLARGLGVARRRDVVREVRAAAADVGVLRAAGLTVAAAHLASVARRDHWRHLHVHSCGRAAQVAVLAHALTGLPYSLSLHGPLADYGGNQRSKWRGAAFGLVITEGLRREVAHALGGDLPPAVAVAPMGVDPVRFARSAPYVPWAPPGALRLVSCGRLNASKGHDDLVRAVRLLTDAGREVELVIAGEDEHRGSGYRVELEALVARLGVADRVRLLGSVGEDEVRHQLERAHVFALASHAEPLGVAIMEAMALELPVVVGDGGGVGALVVHGVTGLLVAPRDPAGIAAAVTGLADDPRLAVALGARARRHVVAGFSSDRSARTLLRLVERTTAEPTTTQPTTTEGSRT
jgi:glycosyltransferase involved in cell wall biosynthesis